MQKRGSIWLWGLGILACCTSSLFADTTNITLTGVSGPTMGGVYTSPYYGTVGSESNVAIICDDFASETYIGESWAANVTKLPNISSPPAKWSSGFTASESAGVWSLGSNSLSLAQAYTAAAYLATQILVQQQLGNTTLQGDYSFALWTLFDGHDPLNALSSTESQKVLALLAGAEQITQGQSLNDYASVTIYSYAGGPTTGCGGSCPPPPQEFIRVSMAEPSSPAVLAVDLLAVMGLMVVFRRRLVGIFQ